MKKRTIIFVCLGILLAPCYSSAQVITQTNLIQFGDDGSDSMEEIVCGPDGYLYVTGKATSDWNNNHTVVEPHVYGEDVVIAKINPITYAVEWATHMGSVPSGSSYDYSRSMVLDASGNIYISGYTGSTFSNLSALDTEGDGFVAKFNSVGQLVWVTHEGPVNDGSVYGVAVDNNGNVYGAGSGTGSIHGQTTIGGEDLFIVKYDGSGTVIWTKQFGSTNTDYHRAAVLKGNFLYTTGYTAGAIGLETNTGGEDVFIAKYDLNGNQKWLKLVGTSSNERGYSIDVDDAGNVYVAGRTNGTMEGSNAGGYDCFILKYDSLGNYLWTNQFGTNKDEFIAQIVVSSPCSRIYVSGHTKGNIDGLSSNDAEGDYFISWLDDSGSTLGTIQNGTGTYEYANGIDLGENGEVYLAAQTYGTLVPGSNVGSYDMVIHEFLDKNCQTILPIELLNFDAKINGRVIDLTWETISEINNDYFTVECSKNGIQWTEVVQIEGAGNSSQTLTYNTIDKNPYSGLSYYRLKQTDYDGQFEYSNIRSVKIEKPLSSKIEIYPNPTNNKITIIGNASELEQINIFNALGQDMSDFITITETQEEKFVIDLSNLTNGMYYIKTKTTANKVYKQ